MRRSVTVICFLIVALASMPAAVSALGQAVRSQGGAPQTTTKPAGSTPGSQKAGATERALQAAIARQDVEGALKLARANPKLTSVQKIRSDVRGELVLGFLVPMRGGNATPQEPQVEVTVAELPELNQKVGLTLGRDWGLVEFVIVGTDSDGNPVGMGNSSVKREGATVRYLTLGSLKRIVNITYETK